MGRIIGYIRFRFTQGSDSRTLHLNWKLLILSKPHTNENLELKKRALLSTNCTVCEEHSYHTDCKRKYITNENGEGISA